MNLENLENFLVENSVQTWRMSLIFLAVKIKNKAKLSFKHNIVHLNWILLCLKYFMCILTVPDLQNLRVNFPNSEGPVPIPKILKKNTVLKFDQQYGFTID